MSDTVDRIEHYTKIWFIFLEATKGFEPLNSDFADRRLRPLGHVASNALVL